MKSYAPSLSRSDPRAQLKNLPFRQIGREVSERIIGPDDRQLVGDTTQQPFRTVCKVLAVFPGSPGYYYMGSGVMVGRRHVLTAGHVLYSHDRGGWATTVRLIPALQGNYMPYGDAYATEITVFNGWRNNGDFDYDLGIIRLDRDLGDTTGWMGFGAATAPDGLLATTAGYPGDQRLSGDLDIGLRMVQVSGRLETSGTEQFHFLMDTMQGQSGSPLYSNLPVTADGRSFQAPIAIGIHCYQTEGDAAVYNGGCRITDAKFATIRNYLQQGGETGKAPENTGRTTRVAWALADLGDRLAAAHVGEDDQVPYVGFRLADGSWEQWDGLPYAATNDPISVARWQGRLVVAMRGGDGKIWINMMNPDRSNKSGWVFTGRTSTHAPCLASDGNSLYLVHKGSGNGELYWSDEAPWFQSPSRWYEVGRQSDDRPAAACANGQLFVAHLGAGEQRIYYRQVTGGSGPWIFTGRTSTRPPAMAILDGNVWIGHVGSGNNQNYLGRPDLGQWLDLEGLSDAEPCLAVHRGRLVYGYVEGRSMRMVWQ